jgi:mannose/cellobiose epimerase-like protein (N-acyl-D-glucosamine 2-epimerase family)
LQFLDAGHYDDEREGYDWLLSRRETEDATCYCYGHVFVLLAYSRAIEAGLADADRVTKPRICSTSGSESRITDCSPPRRPPTGRRYLRLRARGW